MRILIISNTTWDNSNNFGNTFSNLFGGISDIEIYNIACRNGISNNDITVEEIQMTDKSVLKSILNPCYDPCWKIEHTNNDSKLNTVISTNAIKNRKTISFVIRDMIWKLGHWKHSKVLKSFISLCNPDIIYLPIYAMPYMCDVQQYIIKKLKVPVVGHISDDVYNIPPNASFAVKLYRKYLQKKIIKLIKSCKYLEVFAQNMAEEYSKLFDVPCFLIGKGVTKCEFDKIPTYEPKHNNALKITYTGNISPERYSVLYMLGKAINSHFKDKAFIEIYTQTLLSDNMKQGFDELKESVFIKGSVSSDKVKEIQSQSDVLLHIEGFSEKSLYEVKMSFSTKIIDYMLTGVPILAIGPKEANSIDVLQKNNLAFVITEPNDITNVLSKFFTNINAAKEYRENVIKYLKEFRDIEVIQKGMVERLYSTFKDS